MRACGRTGAPQAGVCLTPGQLETVETLYSDITDNQGNILYSGMPRGQDFTDVGLMMARLGFRNGFLGPFFWGNWVYDDPNWDLRSFATPEGERKAMADAEAKLAPLVESGPPETTDFLRLFTVPGQNHYSGARDPGN